MSAAAICHTRSGFLTGSIGRRQSRATIRDQLLPDHQDPARGRTGTNACGRRSRRSASTSARAITSFAVNGKSTSDMVNIYAALVGTAGKQVMLNAQCQAQDQGRPKGHGRAHRRRDQLYYYRWVQDNIKKVSKATGGKVGYLHVPDMSSRRPQRVREALLPAAAQEGADHRRARQRRRQRVAQLIERLRREIAMIDIARNTAPDDGTARPVQWSHGLPASTNSQRRTATYFPTGSASTSSAN